MVVLVGNHVSLQHTEDGDTSKEPQHRLPAANLLDGLGYQIEAGDEHHDAGAKGLQDAHEARGGGGGGVGTGELAEDDDDEASEEADNLPVAPRSSSGHCPDLIMETSSFVRPHTPANLSALGIRAQNASSPAERLSQSSLLGGEPADGHPPRCARGPWKLEHFCEVEDGDDEIRPDAASFSTVGFGESRARYLHLVWMGVILPVFLFPLCR
ncbi:hypothetical protein BDK51DRAFT_48308 [Blyttiomyces helicus]|uniref:Uncharacterized protein n=1 Tax=Blyttiomyces helicus TaxID=388810 RepID=A0A4P9VY99_9FUNG|nr:hypothetical protein BDK51DRAFT_48308 [Blyttiomyces helicus]|eukprot:RKO83278.1 hypothetical protein BDK51DRAFT_48308 [Blyttiomyces helicus]